MTDTPKNRCVTEQERISLARRSIYAFSGTIASFAMVAWVLFTGQPGTLSERVVTGAFAFAELVAMLYMGASVIDRTKLIDKVSTYWDRPTARPDEQEDYTPRRPRRGRKPDDYEDMR